MNLNWKTIIFLIILGIAVVYGTLQYIKQRDVKRLEKIKESKSVEIQEENISPLTGEEKENILQESIPESPVRTLTEEEREQMLKY